MFLNGLEKMVGVLFVDVLNSEVVDDKPENIWAPFVAPESGSCGCFISTGFVEVDAEKKICQFVSLWQAIALS